MSDSFLDLQRFVDAQDPVYRQVVAELSRGRKRTHWMWFIFPADRRSRLQRDGATLRDRLARRGRRLPEARSARISPARMHALRFGGKRKDDNRYPWPSRRQKFLSCMTLFDAVSKQGIFAEAIAAFYPDGKDRGDFGNSGFEPIPIVIAFRRPGTRLQLTCSFRCAQTNG